MEQLKNKYMTNFEKAKQEYHQAEYQNSLDIIIELLKNESVPINSLDYPDILWYLGNCRLNLYNKSKNKSHIFEALTDFATGANALHIHHNTTSDNLNSGMRKCIELL